ncbi:ferredoxin [Stackebrandtia albiflava]|uniref:Ferredoxin n=1 Tax=Stackebrandtia albiflava TaxID=406432 RepID=A0A562V1Q8_9ACTN|nr:ferredoxin [Stackebrandtia albiflava]TWJ11839.1 ferredoxin [Stackebrandtia albiflava]
MRIRVDRQMCVSAGMCALTVPELFDQDDVDGRVLVSDVTPAEEYHDRVERAVDSCPSGALRLDRATV